MKNRKNTNLVLLVSKMILVLWAFSTMAQSPEGNENKITLVGADRLILVQHEKEIYLDDSDPGTRILIRQHQAGAPFPDLILSGSGWARIHGITPGHEEQVLFTGSFVGDLDCEAQVLYASRSPAPFFLILDEQGEVAAFWALDGLNHCRFLDAAVTSRGTFEIQFLGSLPSSGDSGIRLFKYELDEYGALLGVTAISGLEQVWSSNWNPNDNVLGQDKPEDEIDDPIGGATEGQDKPEDEIDDPIGGTTTGQDKPEDEIDDPIGG